MLVRFQVLVIDSTVLWVVLVLVLFRIPPTALSLGLALILPFLTPLLFLIPPPSRFFFFLPDNLAHVPIHLLVLDNLEINVDMPNFDAPVAFIPIKVPTHDAFLVVFDPLEHKGFDFRFLESVDGPESPVFDAAWGCIREWVGFQDGVVDGERGFHDPVFTGSLLGVDAS